MRSLHEEFNELLKEVNGQSTDSAPRHARRSTIQQLMQAVSGPGKKPNRDGENHET